MTQALDLASPGGVTLALAPEVLLSICAMGVLLVTSWRHKSVEDSRLAGWLSAVSLAATTVALGWLAWRDFDTQGIPIMVALDSFRYFSSALILVTALATVLLSLGYVEREGLLAPEYYVLILLGTVGMLFMVAAQDLIVFFLGLETMSVAVYVLAGFDRSSPASAEAGLKYFLLGAFASGFLLYGIALLYGSAGSTNLLLLGAQFGDRPTPILALMGLGLILIGFGFKVAAVPFHMWTPDVYEGAPTPITGWMATGVKAAAFAALARILYSVFPHIEHWQPIVALLAVLTMVVGNLIALNQRSLKRLLAYSSVAHAGYLLVALWPGTPLGVASLMFYLVAYGVTTLAAFAFLGALGRGGERDLTLDDIAGLGATRPLMAFGLAVCMLSLLGFPGTLGFMGKWYILSAVVAQKQVLLAVVLVLTSLVSAGYYMPVIMAMYMRSPRVPLVHHDSRFPSAAAMTVAVAVAAILVFGFWPTGLLNAAGSSAGALANLAAMTVSGQ
jgi:NADH-quinone oxidoreductase subunit N